MSGVSPACYEEVTRNWSQWNLAFTALAPPLLVCICDCLCVRIMKAERLRVPRRGHYDDEEAV